MARFLLGIIAALICNITYAEIYKWVDANGNAQFSDEPPKNGQYQTVNISPPSRSPSTPTLSNEEIKLRQQKQLQVLEEDRLAKQKTQRELVQKQQELQNECLRAKDYLETIKVSQIYDLNTKGERVYKSEQERADEIKRVQQSIQQHCP